MNQQAATSRLAVQGGKALIWVIMVSVVGTVVYMQHHWNKTIDFASPDFVAPRYSGADGSEREPVYSPEVLNVLAADLAFSIASAYEEAAGIKKKLIVLGPQARFSLGAAFEERFDGALAIKVSASKYKSADVVKEWSREFASADAFRQERAGWSQSIGAELATLR
jgi:hypothetical protein